MTKVTEERDSGPFKGKYWIRAEAGWIRRSTGLPGISARAEVFVGPPTQRNEGIFKCGPDIASGDLLDMLQNVERIAREHIETLE